MGTPALWMLKNWMAGFCLLMCVYGCATQAKYSFQNPLFLIPNLTFFFLFCHRQKIDSRICKEAINKFHSNLKEQLIKMVSLWTLICWSLYFVLILSSILYPGKACTHLLAMCKELRTIHFTCF